MMVVMFLLLAAFSGYLWHRTRFGYWQACVGATLSAVVFFQVIAFLELGFIDPFFFIGAMVALLVAFPVTMLTGYLLSKLESPEE